MIDGLPNDVPGRYSVGTWGTLIFAIVFGAALGGGLYWMLNHVASVALGE